MFFYYNESPKNRNLKNCLVSPICEVMCGNKGYEGFL